MILGKNAKLMLKYQKAKAKLVEYDIPKQEYPNFRLNSNELSYPTTYVLSRYSECVIEDRQDELKELEQLLSSTAEYYDSAFKSKDRQNYDLDFLLSGASAYFLNSNFGSAKVLAKRAITLAHNEKSTQILLLNVYNYLLDGMQLFHLKTESTFESVNNCFLDYFEKGESYEYLKESLDRYRKEIYESSDPDSVFYVDILLAVIAISYKNSLWNILPQSSNISVKKWIPYLKQRESMKMLWPAQRLIAERGLLRGEDAIVQLPTGVGKTKSIELIIRAAFLSGRANAAIIVAPLRALCNEITSDMYRFFGKDIEVNQFSDVLQDDFLDVFLENTKKKIFVCTPEKLSYVLHHDMDFLHTIDLFIFDEAHMFDDGGRGAAYELLLTHIRKSRVSEQQLILLSAVLPNAQEVKKWLFDETGVLATDEKIISTPKAVGFTSERSDIHFYSDNKNEEDYFIPRVLQVTTLNKLQKERKIRKFPDLSVPIDVAIYNALKLSPNGGVAIYIGQQRSMKTVLDRILDLNMRHYDLNPIKMNVKKEELLKIKNFIEQYYGVDHSYTKTAELGVLPHSSSIQNGIKLATEYALKSRVVSCVVCTSTLAQGVNIPIKYLLVTSLRVGSEMVKARDFQNLIGRTARAGIYTEGSIIITDSKIYDGRKIYKGGRKYLWDNCMRLLDMKYSEPCSSSILSLVQDIEIDYEHLIKGEKFVEKLLEHFDEDGFLMKYAITLQKKYLEQYPNKGQNTIVQQFLLRQDILNHIENYICLVYSLDIDVDKNIKRIENIYENTLAYALATEQEKELLNKVFLKIKEKVEKYSIAQLHKYSNAMSGIDRSIQIEQWIIDNRLTEQFLSEQDLLSLSIGLYFQLCNDIKYKNDLNNVKEYINICQNWIKGKTPLKIESQSRKTMWEIDDICSKRISYELNFLIGNICDLIYVDEDDETQVDPRNQLILLQKKIKYGVSNMTAISVCETIFNDRLLSMKIAQILCDENIGTDKILKRIKSKRDIVFNVLKDYPGCFEDRLKLLLR